MEVNFEYQLLAEHWEYLVIIVLLGIANAVAKVDFEECYLS